MERENFSYINGINKADKNKFTKSIYTAKVISNNDPLDAGRIKVKISGLDNTISENDNKLFCSPFDNITTNWNIPKVGETVYIIIPDPQKPYSNRLWKGPIIPQFQDIEDAPFPQGLATTEQSFISNRKPLSSIKEANGVQPKKEEQGFYGRKNSGIVFSDNQVTLKSGFYERGNPERRNRQNTPYVKVDVSQNPDNKDENISSTSMIGDMINLISYVGRNGSNFRAEEMTKDELIQFSKTAFNILRGEPTIVLLQKIIQVLVSHTHNYHNLPAEDSEAIKELLNYDFDSLLNKGVKTN